MSDLSDLPGDDAVELASRYVDGDLDLDERAAAEANPEVMAWVERFRGIQRAAREPVDVDADARDAAITAALAALDEESTGEAVAPPPRVGDLAAARARRTGRLGPWLATAAAVVALGIGGAVLVANSGGGDGDADDASLSAAVEVATTTTTAGQQAPSAAQSVTGPLAAEVPTGSPDSTTAAGSPAADDTEATTGQADPTQRTLDEAAGAAPGSTTAATPTTAAGAATTTAASAPAASYDRPADLEPLADAQPVTVAEGREPPCAGVATGELVAVDVSYAGVPAVVYRDTQTHTLTAWASGSCDRLAGYVYPAG